MNFNNPGSLGKCLESTVPTFVATSMGMIISNLQTPMTQDHDENFNTPNNKNTGNFFNSNTTKTNSTDHDAGISLIMAKELQ